jgi:hypothetical protein
MVELDIDEQAILDLFTDLLPPERWAELEGELEGARRPQLYSLRVVAAMMILQQLDARGTQDQVVQKLAAGRLDHLLPKSKRARSKEISANPGAYCTACQQFPLELLKKACNLMLAELSKRIRPGAGGEQVILLVDGTSFSLEHDEELLQHYPPTRNQNGAAHWGIMRVVVLHDVHTGIALYPHWGPMYGDQTVGEQKLAEGALEKAPPGSVVMGDANFGIFSFAYRAVQMDHPVLFRLTAQRARAMGASALLPRGEREFCWKPTRKDREATPSLPREAQLPGRLLALQVPGFRQPLYLFTTLTLLLEQIVGTYSLRWNIELDLRSLKHTLDLFHLRGRSKEAVEKEVLAATVAYGLVRMFMAAAARRAGVEPRRLSFTAACGLLNLMVDRLCWGSREQRAQELDRLLRLMATRKLPTRSKPRHFDRTVWGFRASFPFRRLDGTPSKSKWH